MTHDDSDARLLADLRSSLDRQPELGREALRLMIETNAHAVELYDGGLAKYEAAVESDLDPAHFEDRREHRGMLVRLRDRHLSLFDELERERARRA